MLDLLHDRAGSTQTELAADLEHQKQLKEEQMTIKQELKEELMQEVKRSLQVEIFSRPSASTLQVSAEPFIPTWGAEVPAVASALPTKPATYNAYQAQFERYCMKLRPFFSLGIFCELAQKYSIWMSYQVILVIIL